MPAAAPFLDLLHTSHDLRAAFVATHAAVPIPRATTRVQPLAANVHKALFDTLQKRSKPAFAFHHALVHPPVFKLRKEAVAAKVAAESKVVDTGERKAIDPTAPPAVETPATYCAFALACPFSVPHTAPPADLVTARDRATTPQPLAYERMYLHVRVFGVHEVRRGYVSNTSYCRVQRVELRVLVFPAVMTADARLACLQRLGRTLTVQPLAHLREHVFTLANKAQFVDHYSVKSLNKLVRRAKTPFATSRKSARIARDDAQFAKSTSNLSASDKHTLHVARTRRQQQQDTHDIDVLRHFHGPNVHVRELDANQSVHVDDERDTTSWMSVLYKKFGYTYEHAHAIAYQLRKVPLQAYLNDPSKVAVVAVLPASQRYAALAGAVDQIVGVVLLQLVPFVAHSKTHKSTPAHVRLQGVYVDYKYDEYLLDKTNHAEANGIATNLMRAAVRYSLRVFRRHNIEYDTEQQKSQHLNDILHTCGFAPNVQRPRVLVYRALSAECATWKDCLALVRKTYPAKSFSEHLRISQTLYKKPRQTAARKPPASKRQVSVKMGVELLKRHYADIYLKPVGIDLFDKDLSAVKAALADDEREDVRKALAQYCDHVRKHLARHWKNKTRRTYRGGESWKFRTRVATSYLDGLDVHAPEGQQLYTYPMGKMRTPKTFVHAPNDASEHKTMD